MFSTPKLQKQQADHFHNLRKNYVQFLTVIFLFTSVGGLLAQLFVGLRRGNINIVGLVVITGMILTSLFILWLARRDEIDRAASLMIVILTLGFWFTSTNDVLFLVAVMALVSNVLLSPRNLFYIVNAAVFGRYALLLINIANETGWQVTPEGLAYVIQMSSLVVISVIFRFVVQTLDGIAGTARRSADLIESVADIGQVISGLFDKNELYNQAIERIRDQFGFYHVQIFMVDDDRQYAVLKASTGHVGQQLMNRGHRLPVGSQSVIGRVTQLGDVVIARDTDQNTIHARNELLPSTRSEMALPIMDGGDIIGALDVQSTRSDAFDTVDVQVLQIMTSILATAIRNANLFEEQVESVEENKRLLVESESSLREIQRLNRYLTGNAWQDYLVARQDINGVTAEGNQITTRADWSAVMQAAVYDQQPVSEDQTIAVPIMLRGQVIGALEVTYATEAERREAVDMVSAVAQRLAVSLESARLFEEAQSATVQEQRINQIVNQYQTADTVDELLKITLAELGESLGAQQGQIRLGKPATGSASPASPANGHSNGHGGTNGHLNGGNA